jgi:nucleotide-binding universal stress UspA family protein
MKLKRILVPIDFSPTSLVALGHAADLAAPSKAELLLLSVVEPLYPLMPDFNGVQSAALGRIVADHRDAARKELERLERRLAKRRLRVRSLVGTGRPFEVIGQAAKRHRADLIVMATHGRTGVSHLLTGSVAERVVRTAPCPVLTVRPKPPRRKSR